VQEYQGGAKGESTLAVHGESLPMSTVATFLNASKQLLDDVSSLPIFLQNWLGFFAMRKFENLVIAGDGSPANGSIAGLTTQGTPFSTSGITYNSDKIGAAIFEALPSYGYAADLVIVNSTDFFGIVSQRATTEQYVSAGWNASAPNRLWGVPAISTPGMPQGTAVVLDSQLVSILDRNELTFLIGMVGSQMTENLFTYLAELRGNLAVGDPHAIAVVTLV
jgi:HK97 family phage major capsid protein